MECHVRRGPRRSASSSRASRWSRWCWFSACRTRSCSSGGRAGLSRVECPCSASCWHLCARRNPAAAPLCPRPSNTSLRELRRNAGSIGLLAVGLVHGRTSSRAVAHWVVGLGWGPAFVLGAVVSPTDPLVATAIVQPASRFPPRMVSVIEGESLLHQMMAPPSSRTATPSSPSPTGTFSLLHASISFVFNVVGGLVVGLVVGEIVRYFRKRIDVPRPSRTHRLPDRVLRRTPSAFGHRGRLRLDEHGP